MATDQISTGQDDTQNKIALNTGGLNLSFNFGQSSQSAAADAYSFLNTQFSNQQSFLSTSTKNSQGFFSAVTAPMTSAAAATQGALAAMMPDIVKNIYGAYDSSNQTALQITKDNNAATIQVAQINKPHAKKSMCYITTAVCHHSGLPDDCDILQTLRGFRDSFVSADKVAQYYATAPGYLESIAKREDAATIYDTMRDTFIVPAYVAIKDGDQRTAYALYCALVEYARIMAGGE